MELAGGGSLTVREEGVRVRLEAVRPDNGLGVYKVWVRGAGGRMLLGTLEPENGLLRLGRTLSRRSLEQAGCWPVSGGEAVLAVPLRPAGSGWRREERPGRLLEDAVLRESAGEGALLLRWEEGGFSLAAAYDPDRPFPLAPLFCLGHVEDVGGRLHLVYCFDNAGRPRLSGIGEKNGFPGAGQDIP